MGYFKRQSSVSIGSARLQQNACEDWALLIGRDAVGDLDAGARDALAAHTTRCPRCARRLEREERLTRLLESVPLPSWPDAVPLFPPAAIAVAAQSGRRDASAPAREERAPRRAFGRAALRRLALPLAAASAVLAAAALLARNAAHAPPPAPERRIDLVSPAGGTLSAWRVATICAAVEPPLDGESIRLLVNDRDVTSASECTPNFIVFTSDEPLPAGEHLVALEIRAAGGDRVEEKLWIVTSEPPSDAEMTP